ncbi:hypothetical protein M1316_02320 [Candidatus Parvarchaeota archaeon]|nr:hypothetical protein [Candidatus Parvarchaeota archaeon]
MMTSQNPQQFDYTQVDRRKRISKNILKALGITAIAAAVLVAVLYLLYPAELGLFFNALGSTFNSPSQSKTFSAPGVTFAYPANWVSVNTSQFANLISPQNTTQPSKFGNKSQVAIIVPASEVLSFAASAPSLLSEYLTSPENFIVPSNLSFVAAGAITILDRNFSTSNSILAAIPNANITATSVGGYSGIYVKFSNQKILNVSVTYAELSIAEVNGSVCFVLGISESKNQIGTVDQAFNRAAQSLQCTFNEIGTSVPASILDKFLSLLG